MGRLWLKGQETLYMALSKQEHFIIAGWNQYDYPLLLGNIIGVEWIIFRVHLAHHLPEIVQSTTLTRTTTSIRRRHATCQTSNLPFLEALELLTICGASLVRMNSTSSGLATTGDAAHRDEQGNAIRYSQVQADRVFE